MRQRNGTMVGVALLGALALGCGNIEDGGIAASEEAALSSSSADRGIGECGPAHDPEKDRDHRFHKRCERYGEKHPDRDGRAGNAHLTTRALIDVQKITTVEATTGSFDGTATPPGRIEQMRIEVNRSCRRCDGDRNVVAQSQQPSGYASTNLSGLMRGQSLTITARVSGIDRVIDIVGVADQVRSRPDLAVAAIDVPSSPTAGVPTSIAATVRELQGDEGATADCILTVDGKPADRATGVWVDAAGTVTCHFTTTFATAGAHQLAVDVTNVAPRDYDGTNNHAETTVQVATQFSFTASVMDSTYSGDDIEDVLDQSGALAYHRDDSYTGRTQSASVSGTWPKAVVFPLASVKATETSNGASWPVIDIGMMAADPSGGADMTCGSSNDASGYNWVGVCTMTTPTGPATQISVSAFAGDVTYHSVGACQTTTSFYDCAGGYSWNSGSSPQTASYHDFVGSVAFGLSVIDAAGTSLTASPSVSVAPYSSSSAVPRACDVQASGEQHCTSHSYVESGLAGSAQQ